MNEDPRPFFLDLHRRVEEVFEELVYRRWPPAGPAGARPPADVFETADGYRVEIDLPGVPPRDVELTATGRTLTVVGAVREGVPPGVVSCRRERARGPVRRVLEFAEPIDPGRARAEYRYGTVSVHLPKAPPRRVPGPGAGPPAGVRLVVDAPEN